MDLTLQSLLALQSNFNKGGIGQSTAARHMYAYNIYSADASESLIMKAVRFAMAVADDFTESGFWLQKLPSGSCNQAEQSS